MKGEKVAKMVCETASAGRGGCGGGGNTSRGRVGTKINER